MNAPDHSLEIKERAYFHWVSRGRPQRDDWADWFWAESLQPVVFHQEDWWLDPDGVKHAPGGAGSPLSIFGLPEDGTYVLAYVARADWEQAVTLFFDFRFDRQFQLGAQLGTN